MILSDTEKRIAISTAKNLKRSLISFAIVTSIYLLISLLTSSKSNIKIHLAILSFITILAFSLVFVTTFFHFLFYKKLIKKLGILEMVKKLNFVYYSMIISLIISIILTIRAILLFLTYNDDFKAIYDLANFMIFSFGIPTILLLFSLDIFIIKDLSRLFLARTLRESFAFIVFILLIYFLNTLLGIYSIYYFSKIYLIISLISNLVLIYALNIVMRDYIEELEYI